MHFLKIKAFIFIKKEPIFKIVKPFDINLLIRVLSPCSGLQQGSE